MKRVGSSFKHFAQNNSGWDFEETMGVTVKSVLASVEKGAGLYAGMGIAADVFRYAQIPRWEW